MERAVTASGKPVAASIMGLYFSAHWCPPCRAFTPSLVQFYERVRAAHPDFEIIFVSSDRTPEDFEEYYATMPWGKLPFAEREAKATLATQYGVQGIPRLVIVGADGTLVTGSAREEVAACTGPPEALVTAWRQKLEQEQELERRLELEQDE